MSGLLAVAQQWFGQLCISPVHDGRVIRISPEISLSLNLISNSFPYIHLIYPGL